MKILYDFNLDYEGYDSDSEEDARIVHKIFVRELACLVNNDDGGNSTRRPSRIEKWVDPPCPYDEDGEYVPRSRRRNRRKSKSKKS